MTPETKSRACAALPSDSLRDSILSQTDYPSFAGALAQSGCRLCALSEGRTRIVVDRGHWRASVMVIGEAPGQNEDLQGRAFVGRAGRTFDQTMASVGIDTNADMLICNVAKCRPPGNRPPSREEAEACFPYLEKQIELVRPKVILLLGATALKRLDPSRKKFSMSQEAGRFFRLGNYPGIVFMVFYHPAAALYNSKLIPVLQAHARTLKEFLDHPTDVAAAAASLP